MSKTSDPNKVFKEILAKQNCPPALLIIASERVRRDRIVQAILKRFIPNYNAKIKPANLSTYDAKELNQNKIRNLKEQSLSLSLFAQQTFYVINSVEELSAALMKDLQDIIDNLDENTKFILCASKLAENLNFYKYFQKNQDLIQLTELKNYDLLRWLQKELKNHCLNINEEEVLQAILHSADHKADNIAAIIEKLALYSENNQVALEDVAQISIDAPKASEFAFIDLLSQRQNWKHEVLLSNIFNSGKSPFALLGLIMKAYINYLRIAYLKESGLNAGQIRQKMALAPWIFNKYYSVAEKLSPAKLIFCIRAILEADAKLKNRSLGDEAIFSELTYRLTA